MYFIRGRILVPFIKVNELVPATYTLKDPSLNLYKIHLMLYHISGPLFI